MDLSATEGAARCRPFRRSVLRHECGSVALEVALVLPLSALVLVVLLHTAVLGRDVVAAQSLAREAARVAAVGDDAAVRAAAEEAAGSAVRVELNPPAGMRSTGDLVTADVRLHSRAFAPFGADVWVPARAVMRVE